ISESLTVILTTSPTPSAPSTELVDTILDSFCEYCPVLLACRVVVILDTYEKVGPANRLKKGHVTAERAATYPLYKENVKKVVLRRFGAKVGESPDSIMPMTAEKGQAEFGSWGTPEHPNTTAFTAWRTNDRRVTFIEPTERLGFGLAVRSALRLVETPYVWIQQHDWSLAASIPVESIVEVMRASEESAEKEKEKEELALVRYVCLPSIRMLDYATSDHVQPYPALRRLTAALKRDFQPPLLSSSSSGSEAAVIPLTPLFFWHDKTHIASTAHYLNRIFPSRLAMPRGAFIEDHIGQRARNQMKDGVWKKWACWLYYPGEGKQVCLKHLHGRTWRGTEG
ncbi:hypothetical protein M406DRAFT_17398, partial [Cryphonectria parasitica EP155]